MKIYTKVGITQAAWSQIVRQKRYASLPLAVRIEKATHGEIKTEDIVRPEVAKALREYLSLRISKKSPDKEGEESLRGKEG